MQGDWRCCVQGFKGRCFPTRLGYLSKLPRKIFVSRGLQHFYDSIFLISMKDGISYIMSRVRTHNVVLQYFFFISFSIVFMPGSISVLSKSLQ